VEAANAWLKEHYKAEHNRQFAVAPEEEGTAFVPDREGAWRDILCVIEERVVGNDNTVAWNGRRLQLPESRLRPHFVRAKVKVANIPTGRSPSTWAPTGWRGTLLTKLRFRQPRGWHRARRRQGMACPRWSARVGHRSGHPDPFCARWRRVAMPERLNGHVERPCP
jgi:hypothetical protein